ncbi:casein kinase II subunit alpha'-interacting protein [Molossus nigricans]
MVPLAYYDQHFVSLDHSYQLATNNSLTHQYTGEHLNQLNNHSVVRVQYDSNYLAATPLNSNQKVQRSSDKSQDTILQGCYNRVLKSPRSQSKHQAPPSLDLQQRTSLQSNWRDLSSPFSLAKPQTSSLDLSKISPSLEPNQTTLSSQLFLLKPQNANSLDLCWTSPPLKSNQKTSSSSLLSFNHQETPSQDILWTSTLRSNQRSPSSTSSQSKLQKLPSFHSLWTSLLKNNQRSLSSPSLTSTPQTNDLLQLSPLLQSNQMAFSSPLPNSKPQTPPVLSPNPGVLSLPLSNSKPGKPSLLYSVHHTQNFSLFQPKSQRELTPDHAFRTLGSPVCDSKFQNTTSTSDKHKVTEVSSPHFKPNISGQPLASSKYCSRKTAATKWDSRFQSKNFFDLYAKTYSNKEIPWTLNYMYPCIVKGGTIPDDVVNKIINSLSRTRIQRDLCRQILFRRMRGRPNPHPGPRLSSSYMVCLACASCIKTHCSHLTGKKDPRCAILSVIPTPEPSSEGKIEVKLVFILSLPETPFLSCFPFLVKKNQPNEALEDNLEGMEKTSQFFPTEPDNTHGLNKKKKCLRVAPENKVVSQQPQAIDWLLYIKKSNSQPQTGLRSSPSSISLSSSSSSSSSFIAHSSPFPYKESATPTLSGSVFTKLVSYHRLPPGISWLEFICSENYQLLSGKTHQSHSPLPQTNSMRNSTIVKGPKGSKIVQKFPEKVNERNLD